ncbi:cation diffusion facilitator family transporter containing protein [Tritrichomonas foetus]|uniref:Cation diffusion facilitator family transporter containing protein n=1 Tax=Tritrichomonas foetus TaxID=1144522 RepID=A0A1J4KNU3_9EUKA|nr:cation diffusion facilitator family transporter containing protein [Tritrichomonas foetus]|eukprot:OHT12959.1 cation diffusion facilitator family transporter containing protein [Tritrichomonas foetus]
MSHKEPLNADAKEDFKSPDFSRLLNPNNCQEFIQYLHEKQEGQEHDHDHHHHHGHDHGHDHDHSHIPKARWRLITMIVLNAIIFLVELISGFVTKSLSLQSDAFHMLSDEASLVIGLIAHNLSERPPSDDMSFGWSRTEVVGALCNATFLLAVCLTIFCDAIERFVDVPKIDQPVLFIVVGAVGLVTNLIGMFVFHDHGHSDNLKGVFLHVMGDFFGSIGVMISACVINFTDWKYKYYVDPVISLLIVCILCFGAIPLLKKTAKIVIESVPPDVKLSEVREALNRLPTIVAVHELHVWELSKKSYIALVHIVIDSPENNKNVLESVHNLMISFGVYSTTVQIEFVSDFPNEVDHNSSCFYASSYGKDKRCFVTTPVYRHGIGCPHLNIPGQEDSLDCHSHDHSHSHSHDHLHDHSNSTSYQHSDHSHSNQLEHLHENSNKRNNSSSTSLSHNHDHDQHDNLEPPHDVL